MEKYLEVNGWLNNKRYHSREKGCLIVHKRKEMITHQHYLHIYYCVKCNKECSRSGWEWGWYGGTANNKETQEIERLEKLEKKYETEKDLRSTNKKMGSPR